MTLEQQLAEALAACKLKDATLENIAEYHAYNGDDWPAIRAKEALAIQPDDSALKAWLGQPVGEVKKHTGSLKDMAIIVWTGKQPEEGTKLYYPKEPK